MPDLRQPYTCIPEHWSNQLPTPDWSQWTNWVPPPPRDPGDPGGYGAWFTHDWWPPTVPPPVPTAPEVPPPAGPGSSTPTAPEAPPPAGPSMSTPSAPPPSSPSPGTGSLVAGAPVWFQPDDRALLAMGWMAGPIWTGDQSAWGLSRYAMRNGQWGVEMLANEGSVHIWMPLYTFELLNPYHPLLRWRALFSGPQTMQYQGPVLLLQPLPQPRFRPRWHGWRDRFRKRPAGAVAQVQDKCPADAEWTRHSNPDWNTYGWVEGPVQVGDSPEREETLLEGRARFWAREDQWGVEFYADGCIPMEFWMSFKEFRTLNPSHPLSLKGPPDWLVENMPPYREPEFAYGALVPKHLIGTVPEGVISPASGIAPAGLWVVPTGVQPSNYGRNKRSLLLGRWNGETGQWVRQYTPRIWPGVPPQAILGYTSNSEGASECVPGSVSDFGMFNVPGDPNSCPNGDPTQGSGFWARNANSSLVTSILGRPAYQGPQWQQHLQDQVLMGLIHYKQHADSLNAAIPASIRGTAGTQWLYMLGAMGYVLGNSVAGYISSKASELARVPESERFGKLVSIASRDPQMTPRNAYPMIRAWQRLEAGRVLAEATNADTAWFRVPTDRPQAEVEADLACKFIDRDVALSARGREAIDCGAVTPPSKTMPVWAYVLIGLGSLGLLAGLGYGAYKLATWYAKKP